MTVREIYAGGALVHRDRHRLRPDGEILDRDGKVGRRAPTGRRSKSCSRRSRSRTPRRSRRRTARGASSATRPRARSSRSRRRAALPKESVAPSHQVVKEIPFDSDRKRMTVVTLDETGNEIAHTKGSADVLLPRCVTQLTTRRPRRRSTTRSARRSSHEAERMSQASLRVLAVARRELTHRLATSARRVDAAGERRRRAAPSDIEQRLTFLGLVGMIDPPRAGVKEAIAGVRRRAGPRRDDHRRSQAHRRRDREASSASGTKARSR